MTKIKLTAQEKLQLVLESLKGDVNISELCRQHDIWPFFAQSFQAESPPGSFAGFKFKKGNKDPEKEALKLKIEPLLEIITTQASKT